MHILIAEDDFTSRKMLAAILKKCGSDYEVVETTNGKDAWAMLQKPDAPRIVILDWMMPEMDGLEVVHRVRNLQADRPPYIIMLTTKGETPDIVSGLDSGADDYLIKPANVGELRARVAVGRRMVMMQERLSKQVEELRRALEHIKTLQGIIPICAFCKKVRNDQGYWDKVEAYFSRHSNAQFSHGFCPECMKKHYSEFYENDDDIGKVAT